ncbi:MAG: hypothetical protein EOP67_02280 [Sphingomonas sp.]|nr:MAG: hypothetical protein EOP67_02280 [Sphingomonas sp.]
MKYRGAADRLGWTVMTNRFVAKLRGFADLASSDVEALERATALPMKYRAGAVSLMRTSLHRMHVGL